MTSMMGMERAGQATGPSFLPRCFGTPDMLTGYAPSQPPPVSVYCDADAAGVLQSYGAASRPSLDQFVVNFDEELASTSAAAVPSGTFQTAMSYSLVSTTSSEPRSTSHLYNPYHHLHQQQQLMTYHQTTSLQPHHYRLPYPAQQSPSPRKSPSQQPPRRDITSCPQQPEAETDEINTRAVAARVAAELKRYSVPQAVFAQLVLCRSQGTLSDLLRNPKPWSKLKSGRETFRRMWKWLQEPEYQRMSALRFAGRLAGEKE